ncbi:DNA-binding domain-containing protein [Burkholderia cenocepacia]|uniref:DNA-binding domain-containing protein n=1 Tax=Burkholderia cenocepacia TaxID=95486 RepID=UPI002AB7D05F|nr:DNA-binding domain-containing protein [Burkholderia cenocepacia]
MSPTLAELQRAVGRSLLHGPDEGAAAWVVADGLDASARLNVYRNTATSVLATALRLAFPAVGRLVGSEFFKGAARLFGREAPPRSAWLDAYGAGFADFLARLPQAAAVPYLADVARLEWQINLVLHAPDAKPLDPARLAQLDEAALARLRLQPHPAVRLQRCAGPADTIWRAVLDQDDQALRAVNPDAGPVWLLVQRTGDGIAVVRLPEGEWQVTEALFAGEPLGQVLGHGFALFANHLACGRFADIVTMPADADAPFAGELP